MKKNFICLKKSVRTFKLRIEPSFLSHAERGKPFQIREFLAGMRLCRAFGATPFRLPIPIFNFGGEGEIRTRERIAPLTPQHGAAFNHSATSPHFIRRVSSCLLGTLYGLSRKLDIGHFRLRRNRMKYEVVHISQPLLQVKTLQHKVKVFSIFQFLNLNFPLLF